MATKFMESGMAATRGLEFWDLTGGTVARDATVKHHGPSSIKFTSGSAGATASAYSSPNSIVSAGSRCSFYVRFNDAPTTTRLVFWRSETSGGTQGFSLSVTPAMVLQLRNQTGGTQLGSNGSTLSTGTWYRICIAYTITSTTVNQFRVYLDTVMDGTSSGAANITASNVTLTNAVPTTTLNGWLSTGEGNLKVINMQSFYHDDSTALTDIGNVRVTAKRPFANGTLNNFGTQIGSGNSGYGSGHADEVNEQPLSVTNGWSIIGAGSVVVEEYSIEAITAGDIDISGLTILDLCGWVYTKALAGETGQLILVGVDTAISITTSNALFKAFSGTTTYPAGGTDIGEKCSTSLTTVSLYECGVLVAYIQAATVASIHRPTIIGQAVYRAAYL